MNKYLTIFESHSQYVEPTVKPNVSYCKLENEVHYNPRTWADEYLTFVALEDGTFTFTPQNNNVISYSTDGITWTQGNSVSVNNGDKVMWKGTMTPSSNGIGNFSSTANFDIQGNAMSLLFGDNFENQIDLIGKNYAFKGLFYNNAKIISAENLVLPSTTLIVFCYNNMFYGCANLITAPKLPATTLANGCYNSMFRFCSSLIIAPELPAEILTNGCYNGMFNGCTNLNYIKCLATNISATNCTNNWVSGVAANGTFTKAVSMTDWTTGVNGIPTDWKVEIA